MFANSDKVKSKHLNTFFLPNNNISCYCSTFSFNHTGSQCFTATDTITLHLWHINTKHSIIQLFRDDEEQTIFAWNNCMHLKHISMWLYLIVRGSGEEWYGKCSCSSNLEKKKSMNSVVFLYWKKDYFICDFIKWFVISPNDYFISENPLKFQKKRRGEDKRTDRIP